MAIDEEKIQRVLNYIQKNLDKKLSVDELSKVATLSKYHFHRLFSSYTGTNLIQFIQLSRLKRASFQLAFEHELKIIDIALQAGFESPEAFSRAFKRVFDQTPTAFRQTPDWPNWHTKFEFSLPTGDAVMTVSIVDTPEQKVAYLTHCGAPDRIYETAARFIAWRKETGLSPVNSNHTYGIPHADPNTVAPEDFRFDVCGTIDSDVPENHYGVKTGTIPAGRCAVIRHKGNHDRIEDSVYHLYRNWLPKSGEETRDFPVYFHYLNLIHDVDECDLLTNIYLPIR